jgi:hypothetical protein
MKRICAILLIFCTVSLFGTTDIETYREYFQSAKSNDHVQALLWIKDNKDLFANNEDIIYLLTAELQYDGYGSKTLFGAEQEDYDLIIMVTIELLGLVGDTDSYNASRGLVTYFNNRPPTQISTDPEYCLTVIDTAHALSVDKPLDIIDHIGLASLFKLFADESRFPDEVTKYSKKKLMKLMMEQI